MLCVNIFRAPTDGTRKEENFVQIILFYCRVLRNEDNGELDTSLLPAHLKVLAGQFEREDPNTDILFKDFSETEVCH